MLSVDPSIENLRDYKRPNGIRSSQINPNSSSTNIFSLNQPRPGKRMMFLPSPTPSPAGLTLNFQSFASFQLPLSPPRSSSSTPVTEKEPFPTLNGAQGVFKSSERFKWLPPIDLKVSALCFSWYFFSIVSNNSTKAILSQFSYPVTLTQFQFLLNSAFCVALLFCLIRLPSFARLFPTGSIPPPHKITTVTAFLTPSQLVISTTLPMGIFQFVGHITSHKATSMIPVSLVHTIKALSPIATVLIHTLMFNIRYKAITYITLAPLILGIMLTCYKPKKNSAKPNDSYLTGLLYAFISMMIFVSQNIFAKKRLTYAASQAQAIQEEEEEKYDLPSFKKSKEEKVDKLTILCYCSVIGFLFTLPIYLVLELNNPVLSLVQVTPGLAALVFVNGFSHFLQSLLAFQILGHISTINYSIANILKRIIIILFAFFWENSVSFTGTQNYGIILTVVGLYCYDRWGTNHAKK